LHAVVDQPAGGNILLITALHAGENCSIDACLIHHTHMRGKIREQGTQAENRIFILVEASGHAVVLYQLGWSMMMLKMNDHVRFQYLECESIRERFRISDKRQGDDQRVNCGMPSSGRCAASVKTGRATVTSNGCNQIAQDHAS